ncbi:substrate-binding domain-containing protein [Streptomyces sp. NPDC054783]
MAAVGVMGAAHDLGLHLGDSRALIGYNDTPIAAESPVALTTVRSPMAEQGRAAVRELLRGIAGGVAGSRLLRPELLVRASCGAPVGPPQGCTTATRYDILAVRNEWL